MISRLLYHRRRQRAIGGNIDSQAANDNIYTFLSKIFIETAALYTIANVLFIAVLLSKPEAVDPFAFLARMMTFIGPALIQLRVAGGSAYNPTRMTSAHSSFGGRATSSGRRAYELERTSRNGLYSSHQSYDSTVKPLQITMSTHQECFHDA
jgi:hypothetical protein